jgi:hypothetical protein
MEFGATVEAYLCLTISGGCLKVISSNASTSDWVPRDAFPTGHGTRRCRLGDMRLC